MSEAVEFGGEWGGGLRWGSGFGAFDGVERGLAVGAAVVVDVALGEGGAEPAEERAAAGVGGERGTALAVALGEAEEFGVEGVGEVVAEGGRAGDGDGGLGERRAVEREEALPGGFAAEGAGLGEGEFGQAERAVEGSLLGGSGVGFRGVVVVVLCADAGEGGGELFAG